MVKIAYLSGRTKKIISRKIKYIFTKKTTPQLLGHIGLQNMKVGEKTIFVRWMLTSSLKKEIRHVDWERKTFEN